MEGREEDIALMRRWFRRLADHVQAVDYAGARALFAEDLIAFGTFADVVTGRDATEREQWRKLWGTIDHFRCRLDDLRAIVSADRLTAAGIAAFDSTGYHEDGSTFDRPGRATVIFTRDDTGAAWRAIHTHISLAPGTPQRSFGR